MVTSPDVVVDRLDPEVRAKTAALEKWAQTLERLEETGALKPVRFTRIEPGPDAKDPLTQVACLLDEATAATLLSYDVATVERFIVAPRAGDYLMLERTVQTNFSRGLPSDATHFYKENWRVIGFYSAWEALSGIIWTDGLMPVPADHPVVGNG